MPLEKQVCNLENAKRLKELGVKQESLFYWFPVYNHSAINIEETKTWKLIYKTEEMFGSEAISAPTAGELGEILPTVFYNEHYLYCEKLEDGWLVSYKSEDRDGTYVWTPNFKKAEIASETEADARAKMLIYLLENNLMTL